MSVIFTTYCDKFIAMCADRQRTSSITGEVQIDAVTKIEMLSPSIAIGRCGNLWLCDLVREMVMSAIEDEGIQNITMEDVANLVCQAYQFARESDEADIPDELAIRYVVAGKLANGRLGVILVTLGNGGKGQELLEMREVPGSTVCAPPDMTDEECNELLSKAIANTKSKKKLYHDAIETAHRKAVRYVSERSKYVGYKSDYIFFTADDV